MKRCPFDAITLDRHREPRLQIDLAACRGCGVCATGCAESALRMEARPAAE